MHGILLGYEVRYAKNDEIPMTWETKKFDADARKTVLRNLAKFTSYKVVICAKTSKGCGKEYSAIAHTWDDGKLQINQHSYLEVEYQVSKDLWWLLKANLQNFRPSKNP